MSRSPITVAYLLAMWFVISFVTNILGPIMPVIVRDFHLSLGLAGFLPFSFFVAYAVVSIPAGVIVERAGAKATLLLALGVNLAGALLFAAMPSYMTALVGLFTIGLGMAMLQVVANPLMRVAGGATNFAFYSVLGQLVFGAASFVSPLVFGALMARARAQPSEWLFRLAPATLPWATLYWLFAALFLAAALLTALMRLPKVELVEEERAGTTAAYRELIRDPMVWRYFFGIAAYVATEQSLANWMSQFLATYHHVPAEGLGAEVVGWFWGLMAVGCAVGLGLLKLFDQRTVLRVATLSGIVTVLVALNGPRNAAVYAFPLCGFFLSVMFSIIFALALNSVPRHHGAFSGILCSGIVGGAIGPLIVGQLGDAIGLRAAMLFPILTLAYMFGVGVWARPLVSNLPGEPGATA